MFQSTQYKNNPFRPPSALHLFAQPQQDLQLSNSQTFLIPSMKAFTIASIFALAAIATANRPGPVQGVNHPAAAASHFHSDRLGGNGPVGNGPVGNGPVGNGPVANQVGNGPVGNNVQNFVDSNQQVAGHAKREGRRIVRRNGGNPLESRAQFRQNNAQKSKKKKADPAPPPPPVAAAAVDNNNDNDNDTDTTDDTQAIHARAHARHAYNQNHDDHIHPRAEARQTFRDNHGQDIHRRHERREFDRHMRRDGFHPRMHNNPEIPGRR